MAAGPSASFALELDADDLVEGAEDSAQALDDLQGKIQGDVKALREMKRALRNLKGGTVTSIDAFRKLTTAIAAKKASVAAAQSRFVELGGTFGQTAQKAKAAEAGFGGLLGKASQLPGPLGRVGGVLGKIVGILAGNPIAFGIAAITAAVTALTAASIAGAAALLRYGIAQAGAARAENLRLQGLTTLRSRFGQAAGSADQLQASITAVADATGASRSSLEAHTNRLFRMGLRGENLRQALEGVAIVADVQGERFARRFAGMAAGAARTGRSVRALADDVRARLGGIASRNMLKLGVQMRRLRQNFDRITDALKIEGLFQGFSNVVRLLSQTTASGRALRTIFQGLFQPVINQAVRAAPLVVAFFEGMVIGALQVAIAVVRTRNALRDAFGDSPALEGLLTLSNAANLGKLAIGILAGAALVAVGVFAALGVVVGVVAASFAIFIGGPLALVAGAFFVLRRVGQGAVAWFQSVDWAAEGRAIADGFVNGITSAATRIGAAVRGLAGTATSALQGALGISSPSRVFAQLGVEVSRGLAVGVEAGAPEAQAAVDNLISVPTAPEGGVAALGGTTISVSFGDIIVQATSDEPAEQARAVVDEITRLFEGLGVELGAPA
jgi:hypothetical protein